MSIRNSLRAAAIATALVASSATGVLAGPTATIDGITFPIGILPGGNQLDVTTLDSNVITGLGQTLSSIGFVSTITDSINNPVWSNGQNGAMLAFYATGYVATSILLPTASTPGQITFSGGTVNFYKLAAGTQINGLGSQAADIAAVTAGTLFLGTSAALIDGAGDTLIATLPQGSTLTNYQNAGDSGFNDVTGGDAALAFHTKTFANSFDVGQSGFSDISFSSSFNTGAAGDWPVSGSASVKANASVPEPTSLALVGAGLATLGLVRRKRH